MSHCTGDDTISKVEFRDAWRTKVHVHGTKSSAKLIRQLFVLSLVAKILVLPLQILPLLPNKGCSTNRDLFDSVKPFGRSAETSLSSICELKKRPIHFSAKPGDDHQ